MTESDGISPAGGVTAAVLRDLAAMPAAVQATTEAATAVALARELDRGRLMSTAPVARELREHLVLLRAMATAQEPKGDGVDDLAAVRAARRAAAAASELAASGEHGGRGGQ